MTTQNETQAFAVLDKFADSRVALIQGMKDAGYVTLEQCEPIVIKWACARTGAKWSTSKSGKVMMVTADPKFSSAKTAKRDVMLMLQGQTRRNAKPSNGKAEPADNVTKIIEAFNKLSASEQRKVLKALAV